VRSHNKQFKILKFHPEMINLKNASKSGDLIASNNALRSIQFDTNGLAPQMQTFIRRLYMRNEVHSDFRTKVRILFTPDLENRTAIYYAAHCGEKVAVKAYLSLLVVARLCRFSPKKIQRLFQSGKRTFLEWLLRLDFRGASQFDEEQLHLCVLSALNQPTKDIFVQNRYSISDIIAMTSPFKIPNVFGMYASYNKSNSTRKAKKPALVFDDDFGMYPLDEIDDEDNYNDGEEDDDCHGYHGNYHGHNSDAPSSIGIDDDGVNNADSDRVGFSGPDFNVLNNDEKAAADIQAMLEAIEEMELEEAIRQSSGDIDDDDEDGDNHSSSSSDDEREKEIDSQAFLWIEEMSNGISWNSNMLSRTSSAEKNGGNSETENDGFSVVSWDESWTNASVGTNATGMSGWEIDDGMASKATKMQGVITDVNENAEGNEDDDVNSSQWDIVSDTQSVKSVATNHPPSPILKAFSYRDALLKENAKNNQPECSKAAPLPPKIVSPISRDEAIDSGASTRKEKAEDRLGDMMDDDLDFDAHFIRDGAKSLKGGKAKLQYRGNGRTSWAPTTARLRSACNHRRTESRKSNQSAF